MSEAADEKFAGLRFIQFNLNVNPAELPTSQQKGVRIIKVHGRMMPMFYEKKNVKDAHTLLKYSMEKHKPNEPMHGPLPCLSNTFSHIRRERRSAVRLKVCRWYSVPMWITFRNSFRM